MTDKHSRERALERQLLRLRGRSATLRQLNGRYAWLRLGIVLAGGMLCFFALSAQNMLLFWLLLIAVLLVFNIAAYYHRKVQHSSVQLTVWAQIKATHVARMRLDWDFIPHGEGQAPAEHPFATDIDATGEHSLHRLLDTTVSQEGSARLLDWLLTQTPHEATISRRQAQIRELIPLTIFRDKLTLYGTLSAGSPRERAGKWSARPLLHWLEMADTAPLPRTPLLALAILSVVNIALALLNALEVLPPLWQISWIAYVVIFSTQWRAASSTFETGMALRDRITRLREVFSYLEGYDYRAGMLLAQVCAPFRDQAHRPSAALRRLSRIIAAASIKGNPILWFAMNLFVPWDVYFAHQLRRQQARLAAEMPSWLEAWFELEALCALTTFAYLNPAAVFPTFTSSGGALLKTTQIGHPLIADTHRICNDYEVAALGAVTIITGSNMSGKSTFLRTLGVNLALAYAGAPVIAQALETRLFRLYTCIRVTDSVTDGFSYFYAEVRRLRALLDALKGEDLLPLFFLIDEIFRGTNNRERLIGSRAYIRALAGHNGVGLISTHDLELVRLADELAQISNFHFREEVHDGQMVFDYVLHEGPSPTTNALRIMALAGLPVE